MATPGSALRLLLVEDSAILADLLTRMIAIEDRIAIVGRVDAAEDAIEAIRRLEPDVVVLDLHLRQGTGYDVMRAARPHSDARFVVLTNHTGAGHRAAALDAGAAHFFDKSREIPAMLALIRRMASVAG